jgi:hypothetical protein
MSYVDYFEELRQRCPAELGVGEAFAIDQVLNDLFTVLVDDNQPGYSGLHDLPVPSAKATTTAHPMFLLALHALKSKELGIPILTTDDFTTFNYGYDAVEWHRPVRVGEVLRARVTVVEVVEPRPRHFRAKVRVSYEDGEGVPAMVADTLLYCLDPREVDALKGSRGDERGEPTP